MRQDRAADGHASVAGDDVDGVRMGNESAHPRSDSFDELLVRHRVHPHARGGPGGDSADTIPQIAPGLAQSIAGRVEGGDRTIAHQGPPSRPLIGVEQKHESGPDSGPGQQDDALVHSPFHRSLPSGPLAPG